MRYFFLILMLLSTAASATNCGEYLKVSNQVEEDFENGAFMSDATFLKQEMYDAAYEIVKNNQYVKIYEELEHKFSEIKNTNRDQKFRRKLQVEKLYSVMADDDAIGSVCNQDHQQNLPSAIIQAKKQLIKVTRKRLGYLRAQEYVLENIEQDPTTYATLCHQRKNNDAAYVATSKYSKKMGHFVIKGWKVLHKGDCISYDKHTYTYISWDKPDGRASPPRLYRTMPQGEFCIIPKNKFISFGKDNESDCKSSGGHLETFLKLGLKSETLQ